MDGDEYGWRDVAGSSIFAAMGFALFFGLRAIGLGDVLSAIIGGSASLILTAWLAGVIDRA